MKLGLKAKTLALSLMLLPVTVGGVFASYTISDNANRVGAQIGLEIPTREVYLKTGVWETDNPVYFAHCYGGASDYDVKLTACETAGFYKFSVKINYQSVVFVRDPSSTASIDWDNLWNKTADLTFDLNKDTYEITDWGENKVSVGRWINHTHNSKSTTDIVTPATASDCAVKKETEYCGICSEILSETTFIDHSSLTEYAYQAPTCTEHGHEHYYYCTHCKKYYEDADAKNEIVDLSTIDIDALGHSYEHQHYGSDATNHWLICDNGCGETTAPVAHTFVNGVCSVCGYIQAHTHSYENHPAVAATCTTAGNDQYYTCSGCDKYFDSNHNEISGIPTINALGHSYGSDHKCSRCHAIEPGYTQIHFTCTYNTYGNGDLYICGIPNWDTFLAMGWNDGNIWKYDIILQANSTVTFKVLVRWHGGGETWEKDPNRSWTIPSTETTYDCNGKW